MIQHSSEIMGLFGESEMVEFANGIKLHKAVIAPWQQLVTAATEAGFELALASGYRSIERQLSIWNGKLRGERPVLDDSACAIDLSCLAPLERIMRVMRWSALPGASRHHWGTDMDVYDKAAVSASYQLQLIPAEYQAGGPFAPLIDWLQDYLQQPSAPDFFFPYTEDRGGVMPEPWHLSYRPIAIQCQQQWSLTCLAQQLSQCDIAEKETLLASLDTLYPRFIQDSIYPPFSIAT